MKFFPLSLILAFYLVNYSFASIKALTEDGREVILNEDRTWQYESPDNNRPILIATNANKFEKPSSSTFLLKSKKVNIGVWFNPDIWNIRKSVLNEAAEYEFILK